MADGEGIGTPIASTTIATVADLRLRLSLPDTRDDALLGELLAEAVAAVGRELPITVGRVDEVRPVWVDDETSVWADELVTATKVADLNDVEMSFTEEPSRGEHLARLILGARYSGTVNVTGTWGYESVPADYRRAVLSTAEMYYRREKISRSEGSFGDRGYFDDMPREAVQALRRIRSRVM